MSVPLLARFMVHQAPLLSQLFRRIFWSASAAR
jgi:hypothetical protein